MEYTKPELNAIGAAEVLVLGAPPNLHEDANSQSKTSSAFEFED